VLRTVRLPVVIAGALVGLWLLATGSFDFVELGAAIVGALIATALFLAARAQGLFEFSLEPRWLLRAGKPLVRIPLEFGQVTVALFRPGVRGAFRAVAFPAGGFDPASRGRRAFAASAGSFAPNTIVVDVDADRQEMLVHELVPQRSPSPPL